MKKSYVFVVLISFFLFLNVSQAKIGGTLSCGNVDKVTGAQTCDVIVQVAEKIHNINSITINFTLQNVSLNSNDVKATNGWFLENSSGLSYTFNTTKVSLEPGTYNIATITYYKDLSKTECSILYDFAFKKISRTCSTYQGVYYGKSGAVVSFEVYDEECNKHYCEIINNHYYGKSGTQVSQQQYTTECTEEVEEKHYCEVVKDAGKDVYYDSKGEQTTKNTYLKECFKHFCEVIEDTYYDNEGNEVEKDEYDKECNEHYCEIIDDEYYDSEGNKTTQETYEEECIVKPKYYCSIIDNEYYDNEGNVVDEEEYDKECNEHYCEVIGDTYYDDEGNIVDEDEYNKECAKHFCEVIEDTYYDSDGNIVDKATYDKYCNIPVENPKTGLIVPIISLGILVILSFIINYNLKNKTKFKRI